jgi:fructokinase
MNNATTASMPLVTAIGEALFDCFPDRAVLGGAPLNFIVHMQQLLGARGLSALVSRVGDDELGRELIGELRSRGVDTRFVQIDAERPTGQVQVQLSASGSPTYHIHQNVAWDYIKFDASLGELAARSSAICFGTLAQRSPESRDAIRQFIAASQAIRVVDVNLRQHYITADTLHASLSLANVAKLNEDELSRAPEILARPPIVGSSTDEQAFNLLKAYDLQLLALTRGKRGTVLYTPDGRVDAAPILAQGTPGSDDVGAGDASCAGLIYGLIHGWSMDRTLELANRMGAYLASQPGGTPPLTSDILSFVAEASPAS